LERLRIGEEEGGGEERREQKNQSYNLSQWFGEKPRGLSPLAVLVTT
jgi:hypothetical protein